MRLRLVDLKEQIICCTDCHLHKVGNGPVPPRGKRSDVMIVGEAPGRNEDARGRPFIGPAGRLLFSVLAEHDINEADCFIANAVCCYPARTPERNEMYACRGNLYEQVRYCMPRYILALGVVANQTFRTFDRLDDIRGELYVFPWFKHKDDDDDILVFPTWHPAAILRNQTKARAWKEELTNFAEIVHEDDA